MRTGYMPLALGSPSVPGGQAPGWTSKFSPGWEMEEQTRRKGPAGLLDRPLLTWASGRSLILRSDLWEDLGGLLRWSPERGIPPPRPCKPPSNVCTSTMA